MKDQRSGAVDSVVKAVLALLACVYGTAVRFVDWCYASGIRRTYKAPVPVVSVGNLTLGGTGKTPFTMYIANHFLAKGKTPAILIRGYGADEHKMLKEELDNVMVIVGQDRVKSAVLAAGSGADVVILDDGFQHRRLERDLNIVLIDSVLPFGNGRIFPRGTLREPVSSLKRADFMVFTKSDRAAGPFGDGPRENVRRMFPGIPSAAARYRPVYLKDAAGEEYPVGTLEGKNVCLVSGIADPGYFEDMIRTCGGKIGVKFEFPDHHEYSSGDIMDIDVKCRAAGINTVVVTQKDHVKMKMMDIAEMEDRLFVLHVAVELVEGRNELDARLDSVLRD